MDCVSPRGHPALSKLALVFLLLFRVALGLPGAVQSLPLTCSLLPSGDSSLLPSSKPPSRGSLILSSSISPGISVMFLLPRLSVKTDQHRANGRTQQDPASLKSSHFQLQTEGFDQILVYFKECWVVFLIQSRTGPTGVRRAATRWIAALMLLLHQGNCDLLK